MFSDHSMANNVICLFLNEQNQSKQFCFVVLLQGHYRHRIFASGTTGNVLLRVFPSRGLNSHGHKPQERYKMFLLLSTVFHLKLYFQFWSFFLKELLVSLYLTVLHSKEKIETNCYKFKTKHGSFINLQSQWFSFINPWTKEVEFIVSTNKVVSWVSTAASCC